MTIATKLHLIQSYEMKCHMVLYNNGPKLNDKFSDRWCPEFHREETVRPCRLLSLVCYTHGLTLIRWINESTHETQTDDLIGCVTFGNHYCHPNGIKMQVNNQFTAYILGCWKQSWWELSAVWLLSWESCPARPGTTKKGCALFSGNFQIIFIFILTFFIFCISGAAVNC